LYDITSSQPLNVSVNSTRKPSAARRWSHRPEGFLHSAWLLAHSVVVTSLA